MSQFLTNIIARHSQSEHNVLPRGLGVFETQHSWGDSLSLPTENRWVDSTPNTLQTEPQIKSPITTTTLHQRTRQVDLPQTYKGKREVEVPNIDYSKNNANTLNNQIVEKVNFGIKENTTTKNIENRNTEMPYRKEATKENVFDKPKNQLVVPMPDSKKSKSISMRVDAPSPPLKVTNRIFVKPNKDIKNQFLSNFNVNMQSENNVTTYQASPSTNTYQPQPPSIKIHIGRIDIKAVKPPAAKAPTSKKVNKSVMSLDQFLKKSEGKSP